VRCLSGKSFPFECITDCSGVLESGSQKPDEGVVEQTCNYLLLIIILYAGAGAWPVLGSISVKDEIDGVTQIGFVRLNGKVLDRLGREGPTRFLSDAEVKFFSPQVVLGIFVCF
jgi:hypothetical protein